MAGTATPIFLQTVRTYPAQIQNSDASNKIALVTGAANGSKVESLNVSSTDTSARDLALYITISSVDYLLSTIAIPANSGNTNVLNSIDILRNAQIPGLAYDSNGNKYLYVANGVVLKISALTTVTSGKQIQALAFGGDF